MLLYFRLEFFIIPIFSITVDVLGGLRKLVENLVFRLLSSFSKFSILVFWSFISLDFLSMTLFADPRSLRRSIV